jgi:hypothetical protein
MGNASSNFRAGGAKEIDQRRDVARGWTIEAKIDGMRLLLRSLRILLLAGVVRVVWCCSGSESGAEVTRREKTRRNLPTAAALVVAAMAPYPP